MEGKAQRRVPSVFVVSDALGETAELVARAAASQYTPRDLEFRRIPRVKDEQAIQSIVKEASEQSAAIIYTFILPHLRDAMRRETEGKDIPTVDVMGPAMEALAKVTGEEPHLEPGRVYKLDEEYFRRVEAVEFSVKSDDGKDPRGLLEADVVLLGISRTSKTPVSLYLAQRCHKVSNVPLVPEVELPKELWSVRRERIVGLTIAPEQLLEIRQERLKAIGLNPTASYADPARILMELEYADEVFRRLGCAVVDVTNRAVEETAAQVINIIARGG